MKGRIINLMGILLVTTFVQAQQTNVETYCNPINISYRFFLGEPSRREAADPAIVLFKDDYYLFASKLGGYYYSPNLLEWNFVTTEDLPIEDYAPTAVVINGAIYYTANNTEVLYKSEDPKSGKWEVANPSFPSVGDPAFFVDDDGRVYLYDGVSNNGYIKGRELDPKTLDPIGKPVNLLTGNPSEHGWERFGDYNELDTAPWIEGPWMTKHNNIYYLQYSAPGTEFKSYSDGYYTSKSPLGPFTYAPSSPFSSKPEGFIAGAGHGATFQDKYGNWWHIATMSISVKEKFERRLGLFPVQFDKDGVMMADTKFGDYPTIMPDHKVEDLSELSTGWILLSYDNNNIKASSTLEEHPKEYAFNENVREYWSAKTGNRGEWLSVDLGAIYTINALQINFAENNTQLSGREGVLAHQYLVEYSNDNKTWKTLIDQRKNSEDLTHQYHVMDNPVKARYLKVTNYRVPDGTFAISGFRVFGLGNGEKPDQVESFKLERDKNDSRNVTLSWDEKPNAMGYNIRFGISPDKLYRSYKVYKDTELTIRSLNKNQKYWFAIDAFGKNGVTPGVVKSH